MIGFPYKLFTLWVVMSEIDFLKIDFFARQKIFCAGAVGAVLRGVNCNFFHGL